MAIMTIKTTLRSSLPLALALALAPPVGADEFEDAAAELKTSREAIDKRMKKASSDERKALSATKKSAKRAVKVLRIVAGHEKELEDTKKRLESIQKLPARTNEEIQNRRSGIAAMEKREKLIRGKLKGVAGQIKKLQERGGGERLAELVKARREAAEELRDLEHRAGTLGREALLTLDASVIPDFDQDKLAPAILQPRWGPAGTPLSSKLKSVVVTAGARWILRDLRKRRSYYLEKTEAGVAVRGARSGEKRVKALETENKKLEKATDDADEALDKLVQASEAETKIASEFETVVSKYGA